MDVDPRYTAAGGWIFNGNYGTLGTNSVYSANRVQAVTLLTTDC